MSITEIEPLTSVANIVTLTTRAIAGQNQPTNLGHTMTHTNFALANKIAAYEAIRARRDYTVIGFTEFGLVCWIDGACCIK